MKTINDKKIYHTDHMLKQHTLEEANAGCFIFNHVIHYVCVSQNRKTKTETDLVVCTICISDHEKGPFLVVNVVLHSRFSLVK